MTTTQKLAEKCGHGLATWKVDGHLYHERKDQDVALDGTRQRSGGLQIDACDKPAGELAKKARG